MCCTGWCSLWVGVLKHAACCLLLSAVVVALPAEAGFDREPAVLRESEGCGLPSTPAVSARTGSDATQHVSISVVVPAVAVVEFDEVGNVVSAMTNTGCAPRSSDLFYRRVGSGDLVSAGPVEWVWSGDFTVPGIYVPQDDA